jgi:hypothetical protein
MGQDDERAGADVIIGLIRWRGAGPGDGPEAGEDAEVIRLAPYLLARLTRPDSGRVTGLSGSRDSPTTPPQ